MLQFPDIIESEPDEVAMDESCCDSGGSIDRGLMHAFNKLERKGSISLQTLDGVFMVESCSGSGGKIECGFMVPIDGLEKRG